MLRSCIALLFALFAGLHPASSKHATTCPPHAANEEMGVWVFFTDKDGVEFDPYDFFDPKAIQRRLALGLCLYDSLDYPPRQDYVDGVLAVSGGQAVVSRWFNAVHVRVPAHLRSALEQLPFVREIKHSTLRLMPASHHSAKEQGVGIRPQDTELFNAQMAHMKANYFRQHGFDGEGIRVAVFDAGFRRVDSHPAFAHLWDRGQIVDTWDFHRERAHVFGFSMHGTMVLSAMAGKLGDQPLGYATGAEYLLARTEIRREPLAEEQYWLAAVEWADQRGAHIINSSLGYVFHRYFPEEMDGQTSLVARAASIAASKGVLVVNAAGNMGQDDQWRIVVTPADADSVLSVGALEHPSMLRAAYSSLGPTADGRRKPNVSALGTIVVAGRSALTTASGTSFASPQVSAFAACLWQMRPEWNNMQVFQAIERSADLFPYYDYAHGYGSPQASAFFMDHSQTGTPTFDIAEYQDTLRIILREPVQRAAEKEVPAQNKNEYLYYQVKNGEGRIERYVVVDLEDANKMLIARSDLPAGRLFLVHFRGYTSGYTLR